MKNTLIKLPFATISLQRDIEAGVIAQIQDLPMGHWQFSIDTTTQPDDADGEKLNAFFNIAISEEPIKKFNPLYTKALIALAIGKEIFDHNFFDVEGDVRVGLTVDPEQLSQALAKLEEVGIDLTADGTNPKLVQWVVGDGMRLARKLASCLTADAPHPTHIEFNGQSITDPESDAAAMICMPAPNGKRIKGQIFLGRQENAAIDKEDSSGVEVLGGDDMPARFLDALKNSLSERLGYDATSNQPAGDELHVYFNIAGFTYTAVLDLPYPGASAWFGAGVLEKVMADEVNNAIKKITDVFGVPA